MPDDLDRGRPTVQELQSLEVLEAMAQMERTQKDLRAAQTQQEMKPVAEPIQRVRPPRAVEVPLDYEAVPQPMGTGGFSGRVVLPAEPGSTGPVMKGRPALNASPRVSAVPSPAGVPRGGAEPLSSARPGVVITSPPRGVLPALAGREMVVAEPAMGRGTSPVRAYPLAFSEAADPRLVMLREPDSPRAAAYRVLRYRIEQAEQEGQPAVVLAVCAPRAGQGATTAAANLALALSECNRARVCLVEGNLRRPALAALFGFKPPACLGERLQIDRDRPLEPWRVAELSPSLHVLAVRESTPRQPLVDGPAFGAGIEAMRRAGYRHIVIDGPEVLGIADMNLVEEVADGVLLVARGGVTAATDLSIAAAQLAGKKLRGMVMLDGE